jgi:hypothetical protein
VADFETTSLDQLLNHASELPPDRINYANVVRVQSGANDVVMDFFHVMPSAKPLEPQPVVQHVQRMVLPLSIAKQIGSILLDAMESWESTFGVELPFSPTVNLPSTEEEDTE